MIISQHIPDSVGFDDDDDDEFLSLCFSTRLLRKSAETREPLPNVVKENCRKGVARLHVILCEQTRSIGRDGDTCGNLQSFFSAIDDDAAELRVVTDVEVECGMNRDKETNVPIQRNFESWKGQHVPSIAVGNPRANLKVDGWCGNKVCLCLADAGNLSIRQYVDRCDANRV